MKRSFGAKRIGRVRSIALAGLALVVVAVSACSSRGHDSGAPATVDFKGKTITLIAPFAAGGSSDVLSRLAAAQLGKYLPGNPTIIVKNVTGGGGTVGLDQLTSVEPANGLWIAALGSGNAIRYLTKQPGFDSLPKATIIGGFPSADVQIVTKAVGTDLATLQKRSSPVRIGGVAAGGAGPLASTVSDGLLGIPDTHIYGFSDAGASIVTAMLRGEIDAGTTADTSYNQTFLPYVQSGKFDALYQTGILDASGNIVPSAAVPDIPTVLDLYKQSHGGATPPAGDLATAYNLIAGICSTNYVLAVRQGTPDNILSTLRTAFTQMVASSDWKTLTQQRLSVPAVGSDYQTTDKAWQALLGASPSEVALITKYSGAKS